MGLAALPGDSGVLLFVPHPRGSKELLVTEVVIEESSANLDSNSDTKTACWALWHVRSHEGTSVGSFIKGSRREAGKTRPYQTRASIGKTE